MTEDEAKQKWCPMARVAGTYRDEAGCNRKSYGEPVKASRCIASDCMMWREIKTDAPYEFEGNEDGSLTCVGAPKVLGGYCGLTK